VGEIVRGFNSLATLGVKHFETLFNEPHRENIAKVIKLCSYFPQLATEEDN
jgi:hypothetical protein